MNTIERERERNLPRDGTHQEVKQRSATAYAERKRCRAEWFGRDFCKVSVLVSDILRLKSPHGHGSMTWGKEPAKHAVGPAKHAVLLTSFREVA